MTEVKNQNDVEAIENLTKLIVNIKNEISKLKIKMELLP